MLRCYMSRNIISLDLTVLISQSQSKFALDQMLQFYVILLFSGPSTSNCKAILFTLYSSIICILDTFILQRTNVIFLRWWGRGGVVTVPYRHQGITYL